MILLLQESPIHAMFLRNASVKSSRQWKGSSIGNLDERLSVIVKEGFFACRTERLSNLLSDGMELTQCLILPLDEPVSDKTGSCGSYQII